MKVNKKKILLGVGSVDTLRSLWHKSQEMLVEVGSARVEDSESQHTYNSYDMNMK